MNEDLHTLFDIEITPALLNDNDVGIVACGCEYMSGAVIATTSMTGDWVLLTCVHKCEMCSVANAGMRFVPQDVPLFISRRHATESDHERRAKNHNEISRTMTDLSTYKDHFSSPTLNWTVTTTESDGWYDFTWTTSTDSSTLP